jgi:predicted dienelactone hydrolase
MLASAQINRIDIIRHDAPELAHFGEFDIGVRTLKFTDPNRPDVLNTTADNEIAIYDRTLTVEVWYPALLADGQSPGGQYKAITRNPAVTATLNGRAVRDAVALPGTGTLPLVIVSHGYPGNRYLMSHLGENLASKGYIVASIDHPDSTYDDMQAFWSTLYNRPIDQLFVLDQMAKLSDDANGFLAGMVDAEHAGIVGYSMGGYGLIVNLGGGYSDYFATHETAPAPQLAKYHAASNPQFRTRLDPRIKAGFAIGPWGMADRVWDKQDLHTIRTPTFYLSGSLDATSGYEKGVRAIFEHATKSDRYLLTFINAGHHAAAPIPVPVELLNSDDQTGAAHYTDPVWDTVRMNNILAHFVTAFFDVHLKGERERLVYLQPESSLRDDTFMGFGAGTARGLVLEHMESSD